MNELPDLESLVNAVLPQRLSHETVWHYTTPAVATLVIQNRSLWATSVATMNDREEMQYGINLVRRRWEQQVSTYAFADRIDDWIGQAAQRLADERLSDSFVLCAALLEDSLPLWGLYGYCVLGIRTERMLTKVANKDADGGRLAPTFTTGWRPVIYDEQGQTQHIGRLFAVLQLLCESESWSQGGGKMSVDRLGIECILRSIVYLKPIGFEWEKEIRLYGQARPTGALIAPHRNSFGESNHIMVRTSVHGLAGDDLPIVSVRIANVNDHASAEAHALRELLAGEEVGVALVDTPFRIAPPREQ